tara:strand:+ start:3977 stop:4267 length:291 start_codon:yes stop_codon:yes gene_type:complete
MPHYIGINNSLVEISDEEYAERQAESLAAETAMLNEQNRIIRNELLTASDWTQGNDSPLTDEAKTSWATYRSSLRSLPEHENWPNLEEEDWPTKPS